MLQLFLDIYLCLGTLSATHRDYLRRLRVVGLIPVFGPEWAQGMGERMPSWGRGRAGECSGLAGGRGGWTAGLVDATIF